MGNIITSDNELRIAGPLHKNSTSSLYLGKYLKKNVTIKLHKFSTSYEAESYANRINAIGQLNHPNIPGLYRAEIVKDWSVQVLTKYYKDKDMLTQIESRAMSGDFLSEIEFTQLVKDLVCLFAFLQERNIAHLNIKPSNIFYSQEGHIKVADFLDDYKWLTNSQSLSVEGITGTAQYISPLIHTAYLQSLETGDDSYVLKVLHNPYKSDVFALGITLLQLGTLEFRKGLNVQSTRTQQLIFTEVNKLPFKKKIRIWLGKMLEVNEADRPWFLELRSTLHKLNEQKKMESKELQQPETKLATKQARNDHPFIYFFRPNSLWVTRYCVHSRVIERKHTDLNKSFSHSSWWWVISDELLLLCGGSYEDKVSASAYTYNWSNNSFEKIAKMPTKREWAGIYKHLNHVYIIGGENEHGMLSTSFERFDIITSTWEILPSLPIAMSYTKWVQVDNMFVILGMYSNKAQCYNLESGTWGCQVDLNWDPMKEKSIVHHSFSFLSIEYDGFINEFDLQGAVDSQARCYAPKGFSNSPDSLIKHIFYIQNRWGYVTEINLNNKSIVSCDRLLW